MDRPRATELLVETQHRIAQVKQLCDYGRRLCSELQEELARNQEARATLRQEAYGQRDEHHDDPPTLQPVPKSKSDVARCVLPIGQKMRAAVS